VPGKKIEAAFIVELDEKRLFDGLKNPETGYDQEEIAEHQKCEGQFRLPDVEYGLETALPFHFPISSPSPDIS
jgi:hypothetical protein